MTNELRNGVNVTDLKTAVEAVTADTTNGKLQFNVTSTWTGGFTSRHLTGSFSVGNEPGHRNSSHTITTDEPNEILGGDTGISPAETLISSLAACLSVGYAANAAMRGIDIDELTFEITGNGSLEGFMGIGKARPGLTDINVKTFIKSSATAEQLQELHDDVNMRSPIWDTIRNPVTVTSEMITGMAGTA